MIKKLRQKFVIVATVSVAVMFIIVIFLATFFNYMDLNRKTDAMLNLIAYNGGTLPKPDKKKKPLKLHDDLPREAMFDTRYFTVYLGDSGEILYTDTGNIYATTSKQAQEYAESVLTKNKMSGYINDYKYLVTNINETKAIIFIDATRDIRIIQGFLYNSSLISLGAIVLVAIVSYQLSPFAVKPIATAYEKQKKFITNASHEIKTPITVISANLDIAEMGSGENKWINSSKEQITRLTDLVNSLVALSRMEETETIEKATFSLSELADMVAESYDSIAIQNNKTFETEIADNISYLGNEKSLSQLCYILLDNAFKYSNEGGKIFFSLSKKQQKIYLTVKNTVDKIGIGKHNEFFDRFYREDQSRNSKTGGFGIGLSIAKSIVKQHKGKVTAKSLDGKTLIIEVIL